MRPAAKGAPALQSTPPTQTKLSRLTIFLADLEGGGAERMIVAIANGLVERGVAVELLVARASGPYISEIAPQVVLTDLGTRSVSRALGPLIRHLRRNPPDVLLSTLSHSSLVALMARFLSGAKVPVVIREANTPTRKGRAWSSPKGRISRILMHRSYRAADGVIAVSDGVAEALQEVANVPRSKIATLYNPVVSPDIAELASLEVDHPWLVQDGPETILGVGSLTPRKDFDTLIRAFALVLKQRDARLLILGEGPERQRLTALVEELGLASSVELAGFKQNPFAYMSKASVYVLSSHLEGLPGSLIQALACGCPVVASDCPSGPFEILQGGRIGPLVAVGDDVAMAGAITEMLDSPPPRDVLRQSVERFRTDTVLDATHDFLAEVSARQSRA